MNHMKHRCVLASGCFKHGTAMMQGLALVLRCVIRVSGCSGGLSWPIGLRLTLTIELVIS